MRFWLPIFLIILSFTLFFGLTSTVLDQISALSARSATFNDALSNANELRAVRESLLSTYKKFPAEDLTRLKKMLPSEVDNVRLIIDVDNIAARYGMQLKNVHFKTEGTIPEGKDYGTVTFGFSVQGSYSTLKTFLADLERSLRLVDLTSLSFNSGEKDLYEYTIELTTYWSK